MNVEAVSQALVPLDRWVNQLAGRLPPPVKVPVPGFYFRWQYPEETPRVLLVCKCERLSTSLVSAWELAKLGSSTESGSLLRQVGDFAGEIWFLVEGITRGNFTKSQAQFISQFFDPIATTVEEYLEKEKAHYVRRADQGRTKTYRVVRPRCRVGQQGFLLPELWVQQVGARGVRNRHGAVPRWNTPVHDLAG